MIIVYVLLGVGALLLAVAVARVLPPVRRLGRARAALRSDVTEGVSTLRELVNHRSRGDEGVPKAREHSWGSVGPAA